MPEILHAEQKITRRLNRLLFRSLQVVIVLAFLIWFGVMAYSAIRGGAY